MKTLKEFLTNPSDHAQFLHDVVDVFVMMDFEKIRRYMNFANQTWWDKDKGDYVPDVYTLKTTLCDNIFRMVDEITKKDYGKYTYCSSCGGFYISFEVCEPINNDPETYENCVSFRVSYELESYENY